MTNNHLPNSLLAHEDGLSLPLSRWEKAGVREIQASHNVVVLERNKSINLIATGADSDPPLNVNYGDLAHTGDNAINLP